MDAYQANRDMFAAILEDIRKLKETVGTFTGKAARAEVAGSTPRWDSINDLPAAGKLGRLASVIDDAPGGGGNAGLFWDDGAAWQQVM